MEADPAFFLPASLILGVPEIDDQHRALFAQLAEIKAVCLKQNHLPANVAEELLNALHDHFATEERLAEEAGIEFSAHTRTHKKMLAAIAKALAPLADADGPKDIFGVLRYVEYWFERHIGEDDCRLGRRLTETVRAANSFGHFGGVPTSSPSKERYPRAIGGRV